MLKKDSHPPRLKIAVQNVLPLEGVAPQVRKPPRVCAATVDDSDDDGPTLARSFGEICFDAGRHASGFSERKSWNEQGVGDVGNRGDGNLRLHRADRAGAR